MKNKDSEGTPNASDPPHVRNKENAEDNEQKSYFPKRRSIPIGFDFDLDEVWLPKIQRRPPNRSGKKNAEDALCRTVPAEYYSRHQLLKASHTIQPTQATSRSNPVYSYRPGTDKSRNSPWPSRAHDGTANQKETNRSHHLGESSPDSDMFDF